MLDEPAAQDRADGGGDGGEAGPGADGAAAICFVECGADDGEAAGHKKRGAQALHGSRQNQFVNAGRETAGDGAKRKMVTPMRNMRRRPYRSPSDPPTRINAPRQQAVCFDDPLDVGDGAAKLGLQRRQSHVHHGAVDEGHAGTENGRGQNPRLGGFCARDDGWLGV